MNIEIRNERICLRYKTSKYTIRSIAYKYNLSPQRVRDILIIGLGKDKFEKIKLIRKEKIAEKLKQDYLKKVWGKK